MNNMNKSAAIKHMVKQAFLKKVLLDAITKLPRGGQSPLTALKRLRVALSPKVDPTKLNAFTRLFTKTRTNYSIPKIKADLAFASRMADKYHPELSGTYSGILNGTARTTTRLAPGRIAAALGLTGATTAAVRQGLEKNDSEALASAPDSDTPKNTSIDPQHKGILSTVDSFAKEHPVGTAIAGTGLSLAALLALSQLAASKR